MAAKILLIEDDEAFRGMLREALTDRGYDLVLAGSAEEGVEALAEQPVDLVLSDVMLPGMDGLEAIPRLKKADPGADIIVMTAYSSREKALQAVQAGAYDFFEKPFSLAEMEVVIRRVLEKRRLQDEVRRLSGEPAEDGPLGMVIGQGEAMRQIKRLIARIAPLETTVLITGESGTGKEMITDCLHALSSRAGAPLVKVNCAAIPENLIESELFGHEKGAFTGADRAKAGRFEQAQGGCLMLDEIGEMPLTLQPKLLRVVEQKQAERLGGKGPIDLDVRIVAATNRDLEAMSRDRTFREDLYYRLNVATIHLPPLRRRKEDVPLLAEHFLARVNAKLGAAFRGLSAEAVAELTASDWPGNVRQLANVVERAAIVGEGEVLSAEAVAQAFQKDLSLAPAAPRRTPSTGAASLALGLEGGGVSLKETLAGVERALIVDALKRAGGRQTEAARLLGVTAKNLWNKLQKHGIGPGDYTGG